MKNNFLIKFAGLMIMLLPMMVWAVPGKLIAIQSSQGNNSARLEFALTKAIQYQVFTLDNPKRLVVDLQDAQVAMSLQNALLPYHFIKAVRIGHPKSSTLRLVFDLKSSIKFKTSAKSQKIFLDIYTVNETKFLPKLTQQKSLPVMIANPSLREFIVVIDPGHGGKDPGALGQYGTQEKNVVLGIGLRLAKLINQQPNMRAVLTRHGDYFVTLAGRLKSARKGKADLFMAIHADSYFNNRANGASVYALSHRGATSLAARWLANRENHSELGGVDLRELEDQSVQLRSVLIDLAQTATTTDSLRLGNSVLDTLDAVTNLHYSRVEQAPFMVLKSPDIPSILVEIGFLSNLKEEEKLRDERYQDKMAQALFNGIFLYVKKYSMAHL